MLNLKDWNVAIALHAYNPPNGLVLELVKYLNQHRARVHLIVHPFPTARMPLNSTLQVLDQGEQIQELKTVAPKGPDVLFYLLDILFTWALVRRARARMDLFIGMDSLNTLAGILLRRLGLTKLVVFHVIDYVPQRFANRWLNDIYHWIDRFCCHHADVIWNVSGAMMDARCAKWGSLQGCAPGLVVPWGCNFDRIERLPVSEIRRHDVVFLGSLVPEQGIDLLFQIWPVVLQRVPDANLVIIGGGGLESEFKAQAKQLGIESSVRFPGFIGDDLEIERTLTQCAIGVAPYREDSASFKYYCDPSKVKSYLAAGLPVVITRVPPVAQVIHEAQAGLAIRYDADELSDAILKLLTQDDLYERYRANAIRFASLFTWDKIFEDALSHTLELCPLANAPSLQAAAQ